MHERELRQSTVAAAELPRRPEGELQTCRQPQPKKTCTCSRFKRRMGAETSTNLASPAVLPRTDRGLPDLHPARPAREPHQPAAARARSATMPVHYSRTLIDIVCIETRNHSRNRPFPLTTHTTDTTDTTDTLDMELQLNNISFGQFDETPGVDIDIKVDGEKQETTDGIVEA